VRILFKSPAYKVTLHVYLLFVCGDHSEWVSVFLLAIAHHIFVKFLTDKNVKPAEILSRLKAQFGDETVSRPEVYDSSSLCQGLGCMTGGSHLKTVGQMLKIYHTRDGRGHLWSECRTHQRPPHRGPWIGRNCGLSKQSFIMVMMFSMVSGRLIDSKAAIRWTNLKKSWNLNSWTVLKRKVTHFSIRHMW
jgi:hypothetical protein